MSLYSLPDQTILESEKDKDWYMRHNLNFFELTSLQEYNGQRDLISKYYRAYFGEMNEEEAELTKVITCPNGTDLGQEYVVYPLIRSKIEQIISDYFKRKLKYKIYAVDKESKSSKLDQKFNLLAEELMRELKEELKGEMNMDLETENPNMELPEDLEKFFEEDFMTIAEQTGQSLVDFILYAKNNIKKMAQICLDYFVADRCHMSIDIDNNHINLRPVHSLDAYGDLNPYEDVQKDHDIFFESYFLSENEIYNKFELDDETKSEIKELFRSLSMGHDNSDVGEYKDEIAHSLKEGVHYWNDNKTNRIRVVYGRWKSRKVIRYKKSENKKYKKFHWKKIKDDYKTKKKDNIKKLEPEVIRYCVSVGPNICLEYGIDDYRITSKDQILTTHMDVVSLIRENYSGTSSVKSIASLLNELQKMASEILFELRFALKKAGNDRVLVYDVAQTPKELNQGNIKNALKRVNHYIKSESIMYINTKQKGSRSSFNQFTSLDISQTKGIKILIDSLAIIENLADKFVGLPQERSGDVPQYQTATATEVAIGGSMGKNEILFKPLDDFFNVVIERMLQKAKLFYSENDIIQYVIGDNKTKFLKLYKDFFNSDLGCYFGDPGADMKLAQMIDNAAQQAMSSANTPEVILGLIEVLEGDTASEKKAMFKDMLDKIEEMRQENIEAQNKQAEEATKQAEIDAQKELEKHKEQLENNLEVAYVYANNKSYTENVKAESAKAIAQAKIDAEQFKNEQQSKEKETTSA